MDALLSKLISAKTDTHTMNELVSDYLPFIKKEVSKSGSFGLEYDDRLSIGMVVFMNCVRQFEPSRGNFFSYAAVAIHNRLVDEGKKQARFRGNVVPFEITTEDSTLTGPVDEASVSAYSRQQEESALAEEVDMFSQHLAHHGITMQDLGRMCPQHKKSRLQCANIAHTLMGDKQMRDSFLRTGLLPVTRLAGATGVSRKTIDKYRRYIVAISYALSGDFPGIQAFIPQYEEAE